jgi:chromosome segregation ATPase
LFCQEIIFEDNEIELETGKNESIDIALRVFIYYYFQLDNEKNSLEKEFRELKTELVETEELLSEKDNTSSNQQAQEKITSLEQENRNLTDNLNKIQQEKQQLENQLSNIKQETQAVKNQFINASNFKIQFTELQTKFQQLSQQLTNEKNKNSELQEQIKLFLKQNSQTVSQNF